VSKEEVIYVRETRMGRSARRSKYIEHTCPQLAAELRTLHPKAEQAAI
jgi:hypothetical protein